MRDGNIRTVYGIPPDVSHEMLQAAGYFEEIEVWGKREIRKDPIAVGITGNGERHLICRWGMDKLISLRDDQEPFLAYYLQNFSLILPATKEFWLSTVGRHPSCHLGFRNTRAPGSVLISIAFDRTRLAFSSSGHGLSSM